MKNLLNSLTSRSKRLSITDDAVIAWRNQPVDAERRDSTRLGGTLLDSALRKSEPLLRKRTRDIVLISSRIREDCLEADRRTSRLGSDIEPPSAYRDYRRGSCTENRQEPRSVATKPDRELSVRTNAYSEKYELVEKPVNSTLIQNSSSDDANQKASFIRRVIIGPGTDRVGSKAVHSRSTSSLNMKFTSRRPSKLGMTKPRKSSLPNMSSISEEPVKKVLSGTQSLRRRKKSYECQKRAMEMSDSQTAQNASQHSKDFKLDREVVPWDLSLDTEFSFTKNVWYYGELEVVHGYRRNLCQKFSAEDFRGYMVARVDGSGDIAYSITYRAGEELFVGEIPYHEGKYCLDFSDPDKPRFSCVKYLIADMIQGKFLQRVTFNWLLDNLVI